MNNEAFINKLYKIAQQCEEIKETFFECAREAVNSTGEADWQKAEILFGLAKDADMLRRRVMMFVKEPQEKIPTEVLGSIVSKTLAQQNTLNPEIKTRRTVRKLKKSDYPNYSVRGDSLIKVGLRRDKRTEYSQSVPRREFDLIIARLNEMATTHEEFTPDEVQTGLECPIYQTYIVLALLKHLNLIDVLRRGSYQFSSAQNFSDEASIIWGNLQKKSEFLIPQNTGDL